MRFAGACWIGAVAGCGAPASSPAPLPWPNAPFPEVAAPAGDAMTDAKAELGRLLFYDPILSSDGTVACATCHSEQWGLADGLPLSVGVGGVGPTGPGRTGPNMTRRNALSLWNVAFRAALFWDGRSPSLEAQALEPLKAAEEMDVPPEQAAARVAAVPGYADPFAAAFPGEPIDAAHLAKAIATFERTLVSHRAPYDRYAAGEPDAMSPGELRGMQLFADNGCASCHVPPLFESNRYFRRRDGDDEGRYAVTKDPADRGAFRVPTLRNARETGPYFHDGSVVTLDAAVRDQLEKSGAAAASDDAAVADIGAFIANGLMERIHNPSRPTTVPSGLSVPEDGFRVPR